MLPFKEGDGGCSALGCCACTGPSHKRVDTRADMPAVPSSALPCPSPLPAGPPQPGQHPAQAAGRRRRAGCVPCLLPSCGCTASVLPPGVRQGPCCGRPSPPSEDPLLSSRPCCRRGVCAGAEKVRGPGAGGAWRYSQAVHVQPVPCDLVALLLPIEAEPGDALLSSLSTLPSLHTHHTLLHPPAARPRSTSMSARARSCLTWWPPRRPPSRPPMATPSGAARAR